MATHTNGEIAVMEDDPLAEILLEHARGKGPDEVFTNYNDLDYTAAQIIVILADKQSDVRKKYLGCVRMQAAGLPGM